MDIIEEVRKNRPDEDMDRLNSAYVYAATKHFGQLRQSGEPYMAHPLWVAYILASMNMDQDTVIAGMLHDTLEDTDATREEVENLFGKDVAFLVDSLTKISKIEFKSKEEKQAENFRKMLISILEDMRVIIIKLADRLHNMRTIAHLRRDKQERIAKETLEIYAPFAHRLGIAWIKWELEDLSFQVLHPDVYDDLRQKVGLNRSERENYLDRVRGVVEKFLTDEGITAAVDGRPKHFYSIFAKMEKKSASFDEIYDLLALRVLVDTVSHCYAALGIIHHHFKPVPNRLKDYIAMPKPNMYQSLHTTVIGLDGQMVEFQIRTWQMHRVAEEGVAAHWKYKEGDTFNPKADSRFDWLKQLLEQKNSAGEMVETLKEDVLPTQIYVFTPGGDVIELPMGSTPLDFAYAIHSEVGGKYIGAKVNGRMVHLKYELQNGEKVQILTSPTQVPRKAWLSYVKTSRAKSRIKGYLRKKESDRAMVKGTDLLDKEFKLRGSSLKEVQDEPAKLKKILEKFSLKDAEDFILFVGFGRLTANKAANVLFPEVKYTGKRAAQQKKSAAKETPFLVDGIDNMMLKIARCCHPLPGDDIVGYISSGHGVVVHKQECINIKNTVNYERIIPVTWREGSKVAVNIIANTVSRTGLIHDITEVTTDLRLNIAGYTATVLGKGRSEQRFSVEIPNKSLLEELLKRLSLVDGILSVKAV
jgi:GTP pyrophosphokinase